MTHPFCIHLWKIIVFFFWSSFFRIQAHSPNYVFWIDWRRAFYSTEDCDGNRGINVGEEQKTCTVSEATFPLIIRLFPFSKCLFLLKDPAESVWCQEFALLHLHSWSIQASPSGLNLIIFYTVTLSFSRDSSIPLADWVRLIYAFAEHRMSYTVDEVDVQQVSQRDSHLNTEEEEVHFIECTLGISLVVARRLSSSFCSSVEEGTATWSHSSTSKTSVRVQVTNPTQKGFS